MSKVDLKREDIEEVDLRQLIEDLVKRECSGISKDEISMLKIANENETYMFANHNASIKFGLVFYKTELNDIMVDVYKKEEAEKLFNAVTDSVLEAAAKQGGDTGCVN